MDKRVIDEKKNILPKIENNDTYLCYSPSVSLGFDLTILESGHEKCDPLHYWGKWKKFAHCLHYIVSGKGKVVIEGKEFLLGVNDGFYLSPTDMAYYEADRDDPWEYRWILFDGAKAKGILDMTTISSENPIFHYDKDSQLSSLLENVYLGSTSTLTPNLLTIGYLYLLLAWLVKTFNNGKIQALDYHKKQFYSVLNFIQNNFSRNITINELCKSVGYDRTYIYKMFMKNVGISPTEYIEGLRLHYARELLAQNKMSINEIGFSVGFNDIDWFNKTFKKKMGMTPNVFRQENLNKVSVEVSGQQLTIDKVIEDYNKYLKEELVL